MYYHTGCWILAYGWLINLSVLRPLIVMLGWTPVRVLYVPHSPGPWKKVATPCWVFRIFLRAPEESGMKRGEENWECVTTLHWFSQELSVLQFFQNLQRKFSLIRRFIIEKKFALKAIKDSENVKYFPPFCFYLGFLLFPFFFCFKSELRMGSLNLNVCRDKGK